MRGGRDWHYTEVHVFGRKHSYRSGALMFPVEAISRGLFCFETGGGDGSWLLISSGISHDVTGSKVGGAREWSKQMVAR